MLGFAGCVKNNEKLTYVQKRATRLGYLFCTRKCFLRGYLFRTRKCFSRGYLYCMDYSISMTFPIISDRLSTLRKRNTYISENIYLTSSISPWEKGVYRSARLFLYLISFINPWDRGVHRSACRVASGQGIASDD